jgi:hypothetical protein
MKNINKSRHVRHLLGRHIVFFSSESTIQAGNDSLTFQLSVLRSGPVNQRPSPELMVRLILLITPKTPTIPPT